MKVRITPAFVIPVVVAALSFSATAGYAQAKKDMKSTTLHYVVAPTGNEARYKVREQLAGFDLPNEVVGTTNEVTGRLDHHIDVRIFDDRQRLGSFE